jgi:hypothetical protein
MKKSTLRKIALIVLFSVSIFVPISNAQQSKPTQSTNAQQSKSVQNEVTAKAFVESVYKWHFAHKQQFTKQVYGQKQKWFTPELWQLIVKDWKLSASHPEEVAGIDFDPIINAQEEATRFQVAGENTKDGKQIVDVNINFGTEARPVKIVLVKVGTSWQIANIIYSNDKNGDLISIFKETQSQTH